MNKPSSPRKRTAWRVLRRLLWTSALLYLATALGCAAFQRRMLYFPTVARPEVFDRARKPEGFERWRDSAGQNIGWKRKAFARPVRGRVLLTHGNGGCAFDRFDFGSPLREFAGLEIFILEYPGFGDRSGVPSESSFFEAAEGAFQTLPKTLPVYLLGESLGTGVAAHLAGRHSNEIAGVVLFAPYNKLADVAQYHLRILPASWLLRDRFESEKYFKTYHGPLAIVVAGNDEVVPKRFGIRLFDGYAGPKRLWEIPGAGHNSIQNQPVEFWKEVAAFWKTNTNRVAEPN